MDLKSNPTLFSYCLNLETDESLKRYMRACFVSKALRKGVDLTDIENALVMFL